MNIRNLLSLSALLAATAGFAQDTAQSELKLDLLPSEAWWGGAVPLGTKMPYGVEPIDINLDGGYELVKDQFLMGDGLLAAPLVTRGTARTVQIPAGQWKADDGTLITGPIQNTFAVPLGRLLYFERQQRP